MHENPRHNKIEKETHQDIENTAPVEKRHSQKRSYRLQRNLKFRCDRGVELRRIDQSISDLTHCACI